MTSDPRSAALSALSGFVLSELSLGDTLLRVAEIAADTFPAASIAGITLADEYGRVQTGVYTDEVSPEIDASQYESGRGPCLDAWRDRRIVRIDDMVAAKRDYPEFADAALGHDVMSTISFPMLAGAAAIGALNLYSMEQCGFVEPDEPMGTELTAAASVVLANASAYWSAVELGEGLSEAMKSRAVIEQAKGILMARSSDLDADAAFDLLRRASQRENVKLRDVAQRIVDRRPPPDRTER
jgi:transcriptional regulator with GAF, ATPase, and Fis domain